MDKYLLISDTFSCLDKGSGRMSRYKTGHHIACIYVYASFIEKMYIGPWKCAGIEWSISLYVLQWRNNEFDGVSNHRRLGCLLSRLLSHRWRKTWTLRVTGLCEGNSPVTGQFPAQRASNAENVSIWWHHHGHYRPMITFNHHYLWTNLFCYPDKLGKTVTGFP